MSAFRVSTAISGSILLVFSLACTGLYPESLEMDAQPRGECGEWSATLNARSWEAPMTLRADGGLVQEWTVSREMSTSASGQGRPGSTVVLEASVGDARASQRLALAPAPASAHLTGMLRDDGPGALTLGVDNPCALPLTWSVRGPASFQTTGSLTDGDSVEIPVPQQPAGPARFEVTLQGDGIASVHRSVDIVVAGPCGDLDQDGWDVCPGEVAGDCDDTDSSVNPGAAEKAAPNQVDDNCDGRVDEGTVAYDDDGDGFSEDEGDCDDADQTRFPGAREVWDCRDQNCDGRVDEGVERVELVDPHEPNDTRDRAPHLGGGKRLSAEVTPVQGAGSDPEWFSLYADDGPFDNWGITVTALAIPDGSRWSVRIIEDGGGLSRSDRISGDGESVGLSGKGFRDDSGTYLVVLEGENVGPGCPARFQVVSR